MDRIGTFLVLLILCELSVPFCAPSGSTSTRIDLNGILTHICSLQGTNGYFSATPGGKGYPETTFIALDSLRIISDQDLVVLIDSTTLRKNLESNWGYTVGGSWKPSVIPEGQIIVSYSLLGDVSDVKRQYFTELGKRSQNPDGGIGWYENGESTMEAAYWTVRGLDALHALNEISTQGLFTWISSKLNLDNFGSPRDTFYAMVSLDLMGKRGATGLGSATEKLIGDWALSQFSYQDTSSMYYLVEAMRVLGRTGYDEARIVDMLRGCYDVNIGRFGDDLYQTWEALGLLSDLQGARITSRRLEFRVDVSTSYSSVRGGGWYEDGASATLVLDATTYDHGNQTRRSMVGWYCGEVCLSRNQNTQLAVSKPMTIAVMWGTQYYVVVYNGGHGSVSGSGWYDKGLTAIATALSTVEDAGSGKRYVFAGWEGASISTSSSVGLVVDGPKTLTAKWKTQYYVKLISDLGSVEGENWYDSGTTATVRTVATELPGNGQGERFVFRGWTGDIQSQQTSVTFTVTAPKTITVNWVKQYYVSASTPFSYFIGGNDWYDEGSQVTLRLGETEQGFLVQDVFDRFDGLQTGDTSSLGSAQLYMNGPRSIVAVWRKDTTQLLLAGILTAGALVGVVFLRNRPRTKREKRAPAKPGDVPQEDDGTKVYAIPEEDNVTKVYGKKGRERPKLVLPSRACYCVLLEAIDQ